MTMSLDREDLQGQLDALHILPLSILPLKHKALKRKRLILNTRMEGVVEIFAGPRTGVGQIYPRELASTYPFTDDERDDIKVVQELARMPSFDVYSLRIRLRELGIAVDNLDHLKLSPKKESELSIYMTGFTRPLVRAVYGESPENPRGYRDILEGLSTPDVATARANLENISDKLNISTLEIVQFLENYADIYLSLSYYQQVLDRNMVALNGFLTDMNILSTAEKQRDLQSGLQGICAMIERALNDIVTEVGNLLDVFKSKTSTMWEDISPARFRETADLITSYHSRVGAALCLMDVKLRSWGEKFPHPGAGGIYQRAGFLVSDMKPGLEKRVPMAKPV